MKTATLLSAVLLSVSLSAQAALYSYSYSGGNIPDDNLSGWSDTHTLSGISGIITSVSVTLNLSGGYNGDLYAYLSYGGSKVVLLNRVGVGTGSEPTFSFGYSGAGFSGLVLQDSGSSGNIHNYGGGALSGTYSPDGRAVSPVVNNSTDAANLYAAIPTTFYDTFGGMPANGDWTLFFADASVGGGQSQVTSWSLDIITEVPEPVALALVVFVAMLLAFAGLRWAWRALMSSSLAS